MGRLILPSAVCRLPVPGLGTAMADGVRGQRTGRRRQSAPPAAATPAPITHSHFRTASRQPPSSPSAQPMPMPMPNARASDGTLRATRQQLKWHRSRQSAVSHQPPATSHRPPAGAGQSQSAWCAAAAAAAAAAGRSRSLRNPSAGRTPSPVMDMGPVIMGLLLSQKGAASWRVTAAHSAERG
jgi:hypothetical protein